MDETERMAYTKSMFDLEFSSGTVLTFPSKEVWEQRFLANKNVDPLNVHKPYGLHAPQLVNDEWPLAISVTHLLAPVKNLDDDEFNRWLEYWMMHLATHFIIMAEAADQGESNLPLAELERRVDDHQKAHGNDLVHFAERIRSPY